MSNLAGIIEYCVAHNIKLYIDVFENQYVIFLEETETDEMVRALAQEILNSAAKESITHCSDTGYSWVMCEDCNVYIKEW